MTFTADGRTAPEIKQALAARAINVTTSSVAGTRLDMEARGLSQVVRASVHYYNSETELARFGEGLCDIIGGR